MVSHMHPCLIDIGGTAKGLAIYLQHLHLLPFFSTVQRRV